MATYCGVDFHARQQKVVYFDPSTGEIQHKDLKHQGDEVRQFYQQLPKPVIVGLEATGSSLWFEKLLSELGHEIWIGHSTEIRRRARSRQKNDWRDAELCLDLMIKDEFPRIYRLSEESLEILRQLRYRHRLVRIRTMARNSLHAIALSAGLSLKAKLLTKSGRARLERLELSPVFREQRREWLELIDQLNQRINRLEAEIERIGNADPRVQLLRTHPGLGPLTALALVHTLEPVKRFGSSRKVTAFIGLEPREESSDEKVHWLGISKAGSRLLRFLLIEAAGVACKYDEGLKRFNTRIGHRRDWRKAKVAVARKLLVRAWIMLRDQIDYAEFLNRGVAVESARTKHRP
ncbi:MAG: IS110 family transposase [Blastocatellia bacterium]|nr:IS110 family transposase [Blastocatellia bacterium]